MRTPEPPPRAPDAELIARARTGDTAAYAVLHGRHHDAAVATARALRRDPHDVEDLVHEAFVRVLAALRGGGGPTEAFRPYLLTTLRHVAYDRTRRARETPTAPAEVGEVAWVDPHDDDADRDRLVAAFARLPPRWRSVLWHTAVEGRRPADVAELLGLRPNAVSALAYRARAGLREAYLAGPNGPGDAPDGVDPPGPGPVGVGPEGRGDDGDEGSVG